MKNDLIKKYNIPGPRYTSYPTVPYWNPAPPSEDEWKTLVRKSYNESKAEGISLYVHLPFCESLCTYCGCNTRITINHAVESTYINALLKEWRMYCEVIGEKPFIRDIHLGGGTPTFFSPENLERLIEGIGEDAIINDNTEAGFEGHPNNTTSEHLKVLHSLGFERVSFGIQDFDAHVQDAINRIQTFDTVKKITKEAKKIGYTSINYDLIYGLPGQTVETITDTIYKVILLNPDRIAFYSYAHVPWIKPSQRKFTEADLPADQEKLQLYETGRNRLEMAGYIEIGMDHFALKSDSLFTAMQDETLHRNFMGYTTMHTQLMIGLGASSISDSWTGFVQNVKKIEDYYKLINEGKLPFFRGHALSQEDLIIRKHILNIMCKSYTSWNKKEMQFDEIDKVKDHLRELEADHIIELGADFVRVKPHGKAFIRNVCMAFDKNLWNTNTENKFSKTV